MKKSRVGFLFILPWVLGFVIFTVFPIIAALYIAMTDWSIIGRASFVGLQNFRDIFADPAFYKALTVTGRYAILAIPLTIITALLVALSVNNDYKGIGIFWQVRLRSIAHPGTLRQSGGIQRKSTSFQGGQTTL